MCQECLPQVYDEMDAWTFEGSPILVKNTFLQVQTPLVAQVFSHIRSRSLPSRLLRRPTLSCLQEKLQHTSQSGNSNGQPLSISSDPGLTAHPNFANSDEPSGPPSFLLHSAKRNNNVYNNSVHPTSIRHAGGHAGSHAGGHAGHAGFGHASPPGGRFGGVVDSSHSAQASGHHVAPVFEPFSSAVVRRHADGEDEALSQRHHHHHQCHPTASLSPAWKPSCPPNSMDAQSSSSSLPCLMTAGTPSCLVGSEVFSPAAPNAARTEVPKAAASFAPFWNHRPPVANATSPAATMNGQEVPIQQGVLAVETRTTVMIRSLPAGFARGQLEEVLEREGFAGSFNFIYIPSDIATGNSFHYAFVNFVTPEEALRCQQHFTGFTSWPMPCPGPCRVDWSEALQGLNELIQRYRNSPLMHQSVPDGLRPALFTHGRRVAFPSPTTLVRAPRVRRTSSRLPRSGSEHTSSCASSN